MAADTISRTAAAAMPAIPSTCLIVAPIWGAAPAGGANLGGQRFRVKEIMNTISREGAAFGSASKHSGTNYATSSGRGKESKLPKDCAIRRLLLILLTITILIGLPRLADKFREDRISQKGKPTGTSPLGIAQQNPSKTESGPSLPTGVNSEAPSASAQAIPVSLKTSDVQTSSKAETPRAGPASLPASEDELISAIQKELIRIGYYAGPFTGKWSKASRAAARSFARQANGHARHPKPTLKLLSTLQAARP